MKKYRIGFSVLGRYYVEVEAETLAEAKSEGENRFSDANFGELDEISGFAVCADDDNGKRIYFK